MNHKVTDTITLESLRVLMHSGNTIVISSASRQAMAKGRKVLEEQLKKSKTPIYGINTGFGALYNTSVAGHELEQLQENLVMSHACGTGEEVAPEIVRLMIVLKIQGLSLGYSGVRPEVVDKLAELYNNDVLPVVYNQGSLGASGDLAPLAHLSLPLIGKGEVMYKGKKQDAAKALKQCGIEALTFRSKEALALLNGTQFMSAHATWCIIKALDLSEWADTIGTLSLEAFDGRPEPFDAQLHTIRPHKGQQDVAARIRKLLAGSLIIKKPGKHVQDPYSFRCMPQVHGASLDAIRYALSVLLIEINSVTDNPTIFPETGDILSGGNFHGQPLALMLDFLAIALAELGSISERRTYQLISGQRGLPPFLVSRPGLNSGLMIPQYTAASLVSQNKQLCTPASVDSIVSSNGQEDHVSMGANAASKCKRIVENVENILSIELLNAAQALEFRRPLRSSPALEKVVSEYRKTVPRIQEDRIFFKDIREGVAFLRK